MNQHELYLLLSSGDEGSAKLDKTLLVKRSKLSFNEKDCQVFNFQDISTYRRLKREEENNKLLAILCSSVHHEMTGPLRCGIELAVRLMRNLKNNPPLRKLAQLILLCCKHVLLHANDLIDKQLL